MPPYFPGIFLLHFRNPFLGLIFVLSRKINPTVFIYEKHICEKIIFVCLMYCIHAAFLQKGNGKNE